MHGVDGSSSRAGNGNCNDVIVIGAGLAGLACAVALADAGLHVGVLEASAEPGGRARSWRHVATGDSVDIGPHVFHSEYANALAFLERLGTRQLITWQPDPVLTLADSNGPPRSLSHRRGLPPPLSLLPDMARASQLPLPDLVSNNGPTWRALKYGEEDIDELDRHAGLDLLRALGTSEPMIDWFWRLASITAVNVPLERVSAAAVLRVHSQLIGHRRLHFGFAQAGLSDLYVPQAISVIVARGGWVRCGTEAVALYSSFSGGDGPASPRCIVRMRDGSERVSRCVVLAMPPDRVAALAPGVVPDLHVLAEPSPYCSIYLWFDRPLPCHRFWALLYKPDRLNCDYYDLTQIRPALAGRDAVIASNIVYSHRAAGLSDEEIVQVTLQELALAVPEARTAALRHADVHHIPMAVPCAVPGFERARPLQRTARPGVFLAGDWTRTGLPCSMESATRSGLLAAEEVLAALGRPAPRPLAIEPRMNDGLAGLVRRTTRTLRRMRGIATQGSTT
jgi:15-cis-phytoene desaturase